MTKTELDHHDDTGQRRSVPLPLIIALTSAAMAVAATVVTLRAGPSGLWVIVPAIAYTVFTMSSGRKPAIGSWTTTLATVLAGAVTVLAIGIQLVSHRGTPTPSATPPAARAGTVSVQISAPLSNATVPRLLTVQGTAHLQSDQALWVAVRNARDVRYYLVSRGPVAVGADQKWQVANLHLGSPSQTRAMFAVIAFVTNADATNEIKSIVAGTDVSQTPSFDSLPAGVVAAAQVLVTLTD